MLREALPVEATIQSTGKERFLRYLDVKVVKQYGGMQDQRRAWPGRERNVVVWWALANGYAVGWNENPSRGWSFPVTRLKAAT